LDKVETEEERGMLADKIILGKEAILAMIET